MGRGGQEDLGWESLEQQVACSAQYMCIREEMDDLLRQKDADASGANGSYLL